MSRRKLSKRNIRKLTRVGGTSLCVTIPKEYLSELSWRERQKVVVSRRGKTITIKDWEKKQKKHKNG
ncbi:MAG: hypothetical protein V3T98_00055 [Candidatus Paceibacterota bacterium]